MAGHGALLILWPALVVRVKILKSRVQYARSVILRLCQTFPCSALNEIVLIQD